MEIAFLMNIKKPRWLSEISFKSSLRAILVILVYSMILSCRTQDSLNLLKIGLPEEPKALNIWLVSDANSRKILSLIYQPLYVRDPQTLKIIPWLAKEDPVFDKENLTYTVKLKKARWSDGSDFTADDILFTKNLFARFKMPRYHSRWKVIKKIDVINKHTIVFSVDRKVFIEFF